MQGDWWHRGFSNRPGERYVALSSSLRAWEIPKTEAGNSPKIVTLTVQPLPAEHAATGQHPHCVSRSRHLSMASTESVLAQRRRKLSFKNKMLLNNSRPVSMSAGRENLEMQDLTVTWTNFLEKHFSTSSSNSPYAAGPDLNASGGSFNSSNQQPAETGNPAKHPAPGTDGYRSLERKLEREREKRTHGETPAGRLEPKVLPEESSQPTMDVRRNSFRLASSNGKSPSGNGTQRHADHSTAAASSSSGSYRTQSNRDALSSMGSLTMASTPSSAALRGHSIGFGSRDMSMRSPTMMQRGKTRGGTIMPLTVNDKLKGTRYPFVDPVPSASPSFQQRLSELAALESDTIRYERTKRIKKRSKQESQ